MTGPGKLNSTFAAAIDSEVQMYIGFRNPLVVIVFGLIVAALAIGLFVWLYYFYLPSVIN